MKIFVKSRSEIKKLFFKDPKFIENNFVISIFSSMPIFGSFKSPLPSHGNVCKLCFDDVTEKDTDPIFIHFNQKLAKKIVDFIMNIKDDGSKNFYVHCDAGVSRSGAVGFLLNEWFNKFIAINEEDNEFFKKTNSHISPNPEVMRTLKVEMFGEPFFGIPVNDYEFDKDGNKIDHMKEI